MLAAVHVNSHRYRVLELAGADSLAEASLKLVEFTNDYKNRQKDSVHEIETELQKF